MKTNKMCAIFSNEHEYNELKPLTNDRSLSTLYFAGKYRLMDFPLSSIVNANIRSVYTLVNEGKVKSFLDHLGGSKEWGLDTIGSYQYMDFYQKLMEKKIEGQDYFDAVIEFLKISMSPYTVFISNKMLCNVDLRSVLKYHQDSNNKITPVFKRVPASCLAPDDQVFTLDEKNNVLSSKKAMMVDASESYNLYMDICVADTDWLISVLEKGQRSGASIEAVEQTAALAAKYTSSAYEYVGYLRNIHDISGYYEANLDMLDKTHMDSLLNGNQKIVTRVKNEVGTYFAPSSKVSDTMLSTGSRIYGQINHSILSRRVTVAQNAQVKNAIVMANDVIEEGSVVENAILDKNVKIKAGVTIKGTPEKPIVIEKNTTVTADVIERG